MNNQSNRNETFNLGTFGNDVLIYSFGQVALLLFGFIQSLIIPKYLSTVDYGNWQLFLLWTTYVGLLQFGFLSGLLVRWAGRDINELSEEIPLAFKGIILVQALVIVLLIPIAIYGNFLPKEIAFAVLASTFISNVLTFFIVISQSIKQFKTITKANIANGSLFLIFLLIIFFYGYISYIPLIFATLFSTLLLILFYIFHFRKYLFLQSTVITSLPHYLMENIGIGIFVLLGNFIALIFVTIDRLIVGSFFSITQFAVYAFAVTLSGLAMLFLQAVAQVFFPYLSGSGSETRKKAYRLLKPAIVIFWAGFLAVYYPFSAWIRYFLPHYADSLPLMAILVCTVGFSAQIQILHANFFKVYLKQREYFLIAGASLVVAVALNLLAFFIFGTLTAVAVTAVVSIIFWYLFNEVALRHLVAFPIREIVKWLLVIGMYIGAFLGSYTLPNTWVMGCSIYIVLFAGITFIFLRREMEQVWDQIVEIKIQMKSV